MPEGVPRFGRSEKVWQSVEVAAFERREGVHNHEGSRLASLLAWVLFRELDTTTVRPFIAALVMAQKGNPPSGGILSLCHEIEVRGWKRLRSSPTILGRRGNSLLESSSARRVWVMSENQLTLTHTAAAAPLRCQ